VKATRLAALVFGIGGIGAAVFLSFAYFPAGLFTPSPNPRVPLPLSNSMLPKGTPSRFLKSMPIGAAITDKDRPMVANVNAVDLDQDGMLDVVACVVHENRVVWLRQYPRGVFTETQIGSEIRAPAHAEVVDFDGDGDLDVLVAGLGVLFPSNAKIGSVVLLENQGDGRFVNRVLIEGIPRAADARAADLDGDGKLDVAVAAFGYDDGATLWLRNMGGGHFEPHVLLGLSGAINVELVDIDGDGDRDIVCLVSQEWEEVFLFINDGHGNFKTQLVWGSTNPDFGSSWLTATDLDKDGDIDFLYSNGDAFDYAPPSGRPWHGVQWIENKGNLEFVVHRIADFSGASSPQPIDMDGDGDIDVAVVSAYNAWDDPSAQSLIWLENDGQMRFTLHEVANAPTHLITLSVGDFNGDGLPDLVTGGMHINRPYDRLSRITLWINGWRGIRH
jgi:hypothetical protein